MEAVNQVVSVSLDSISDATDYSTPMSAGEVDTLSDQFAAAMSDLKVGVSENVEGINETIASIDSATTDPSKLFELQVKLTEVTLEQELLSKGISQCTKNVETVVKAQ
ncbi:EscI/YscI/HrpB family type III secretion system inner rod protein [Motilimonas pumila]|uniref:EscI/YscI/HrpB family type III secretion system inner rod protein n=1 Tax=Motilimonas pumila TaxID=2303987 RepID=A0A418YE10_9GAMM|nr:EscI/YscI/HrpB family type III secretion system inner rod protein [Motilimonas pumila]RJG42759.1 hypothetical protein D1Z90_11765 [Motilimonas pumila]